MCYYIDEITLQQLFVGYKNAGIVHDSLSFEVFKAATLGILPPGTPCQDDNRR